MLVFFPLSGSLLTPLHTCIFLSESLKMPLNAEFWKLHLGLSLQGSVIGWYSSCELLSFVQGRMG